MGEPALNQPSTTLARIAARMDEVRQMQREQMVKDVDYGIIPGTKKPTLYKPGAEKLCQLFGLSIHIEMCPELGQQNSEVISHVSKCILSSIKTGEVIAEGFGSCNSMEEKYHFRYIPTEEKPSDMEALQAKARGTGGWRKIYVKKQPKWAWCLREPVDSPWPFDNTILKMSNKRAVVAATLLATAASNVFTQDLADEPEDFGAPDEEAPVMTLQDKLWQALLKISDGNEEIARNKLAAMTKQTDPKKLSDSAAQKAMERLWRPSTP